MTLLYLPSRVAPRRDHFLKRRNSVYLLAIGLRGKRYVEYDYAASGPCPARTRVPIAIGDRNSTVDPQSRGTVKN